MFADLFGLLCVGFLCVLLLWVTGWLDIYCVCVGYCVCLFVVTLCLLWMYWLLIVVRCLFVVTLCVLYCSRFTVGCLVISYCLFDYLCYAWGLQLSLVSVLEIEFRVLLLFDIIWLVWFLVFRWCLAYFGWLVVYWILLILVVLFCYSEFLLCSTLLLLILVVLVFSLFYWLFTCYVFVCLRRSVGLCWFCVYFANLLP